MNNPKVSIIFPNYNGGRESLKCLTSIRSLNYPQDKTEVIVVDNNSSDGSDLAIAKGFGEVILIKNKKNLGFAKAVNLGILQAKGSDIFVTNNDVVLQKNCLTNLVNFVKNYNEIGVTGPVVAENVKSHKVVRSLKYNFYTGTFEKSENLTDSDWISGAGMFFAKTLWKKLGGFDEGFFFTFEDLDFCLRAKKLGVKIKHCQKAIIWHNEGSTVNKPEFAYFKYYEGYKSKLRLILKHGNIFQIISSLLLQFIVFAPYRFLVIREKSLIPLLAATVWNFKHLPQTLVLRNK